MEPTLRDLGECGDIIRNMHTALKADGLERDPMTFQLHDAAPETPIVGRVVDKCLTDEMGENLTVVVDGIDGRTHHVPGIDPARVEGARIGSVIEIRPAETTQRPSDRTIATIAEDGIYRPSRHLEQAKFEGRVPGGDYEGFVDAHVRRLEALRRAAIVERIDADQWRIPEDFESRAAAYDEGPKRLAQNIRAWRDRLEDGGFRPHMTNEWLDLIDDPNFPRTPLRGGYTLKTGRKGLIDLLGEWRDAGINHAALGSQFASRPAAEIIQELAEDVLPLFPSHEGPAPLSAEW